MCTLIQRIQAVQSAHTSREVFKGINVLFSISNWNNSFEILIIDRPDFLFG
jgi:hypothetical protein